MDVRAENRGRPHQKVRFPAAPVAGRNFLTPGHPGVRVRNVRGKFGPKSLCLCCFCFPETNSPEFEVGNGKIYQCPKKSFWVLSRSFWRETWHCSADIQGPLSVNFPELPIRNSEEFEVGNGKNYLHPKKSPIFFSRSVKILARMVCSPYEQEKTILGDNVFAVFWALLVANPLPPTPFRNLWVTGFSTPNMTGRRFHRTTEAIPRRPWKAKSPFASRPMKINIKEGTQGVRARYDAVLPPFISFVRSPSCPVFLVPEILHFFSARKSGKFLNILGSFPKSHRKPGERGKNTTGENSTKSRGDGTPKLQISAPCRGRTRPEKRPPSVASGESLRATRIGAAGPRASERQTCLSEGLWEGGFRVFFQRFSEVFRGFQRFSEFLGNGRNTVSRVLFRER